MTRAPLVPLLLTASAVLVGCGSGATEAGPVPTAATAAGPTRSAPVVSTGTATTPGMTSVETRAHVVCKPQTGGDEGVFTNLTDVRVGAHRGFDRIVFEFQAPKPNPGGHGGVPRYEIRQAQPPFTEDPSGMPIDVSGDAFVRLVIHGATGIDLDGNPTYTGPGTLTPGFGTLAQAVEGGDFEATLIWILGLSRPTCWTTHELHDPDRLVVDFFHA
jgi:hypothetical protein